MVECELESLCHVLNCTVLIDTWWNVNMDQGILYQTADAVLIDTWWNVNFVTSRSNDVSV